MDAEVYYDEERPREPLRRRPMSTTCRSFFVLPFVLFLAACGGSKPPAPKSAGPKPGTIVATTAGDKEAVELFKSLCSTCHGMTGKGDGPGAAAINPKPRSFSDGAWQASVTDEQIQKTIVFGGAAVGKSPYMPAQPDLKGKKDVLDGLTKIVRSYRPK
jgi:mono/diheme cytochrome c family protein